MANALSTRRRILAVLSGGFVGTLLRYGLSTVLQIWLGKGWPYDLLLINVTGAGLLAVVTTLADAALLIGPTRRLFLTTGLLGAYTTFSSLALADVLLFAKGAWFPALGYLILSLLGGMSLVLVGNWLGQRLVASLRRRSRSAECSQSPRLAREQEVLRLPAQAGTLRRRLP